MFIQYISLHTIRVDLISLQQLVSFLRMLTYWVWMLVNYRLYRTTTFHLIVLKETLGHNLSKSSRPSFKVNHSKNMGQTHSIIAR